MKRREIREITFNGTDNKTEFTFCFYMQLLTELKIRGFLTERQYLKGLALLGAGT